jgi:hypothetical protein
MAAPIGIDIRDKKLVFNGKLRIFQGVWGKQFYRAISQWLFSVQ